MAIFNNRRCLGISRKGKCKYTDKKCCFNKYCFVSKRYYNFYKRLAVRTKLKEMGMVLDSGEFHLRVMELRLIKDNILTF